MEEAHAAARAPVRAAEPAAKRAPAPPRDLPPKRQRTSERDQGDVTDRLRAALVESCGLDWGDFDPEYDLEYSGDQVVTKRGSEEYYVPPKGWVKIGLSVLHRHEDSAWLSRSSWPVVYHGTSAASSAVKGIVEDGFKIRGGLQNPRNGERLGAGVYCSPLIDKARQYADVPLFVDGEPFILIFQCRVRQDKYEQPEPDIWLVKDAGDIRPCGILLHPLALCDQQWISYRSGSPYRDARTVGEAKGMGRRLPDILRDLQSGHVRLRRYAVLPRTDSGLPVADRHMADLRAAMGHCHLSTARQPCSLKHQTAARWRDERGRHNELGERSDPKAVLETLGTYPKGAMGWMLVQDVVWANHEPLPEGWIRCWSKSRGREYYYRLEDGFTTCDRVAAAPSDPKAVLETLSTHPEDPVGWMLVQDVVWANHEPLPEGWIRCWSKPHDCEYYLRLEDGFTTFERAEAA